MLVCQAHAGVTHRKPKQHLGVTAFNHASSNHDSAFFSEFDGVVGVIDQDLAYPQRVPDQHARHIARNIKHQFYAFGAALLTDQGRQVVQYLVKFEIYLFNVQLASFDFGQIQNVIDDAQQMLTRPVHFRDVVALA